MSASRNNGPLEFDFASNDEEPKSPAPEANSPSPKEEEFIPLEKDPTAVVFKGPERPKHFSKPLSSDSQPLKNPQPVKKEEPLKKAETMSNPIPTAINARKNIERQEREQRTFTTILGSAATILLIIILLVGGMAGFGGYVLWKQIQQQSVTVSLLEANLRQSIAKLEDETKKNDLLANQRIDAQAALIAKLRAENEAQAADIRSLQVARKQHEIVLDRLSEKLDEDRRFNTRR